VILPFTPLSPAKLTKLVCVGIVKVESNATIERVQADLRAILPDDLLVLTSMNSLLVNVKTGSHRLYLWLWRSDWVLGRSGNCLSDSLHRCFHLPEYATLKAMGYSDAYLIGVIIQSLFS